MYDSSDLRSTLASAPRAKAPVTDYADADMIEFHEVPPSDTGAGYRTWYGRGQNFIVAYTEADTGAMLERSSQPDEYMLFLPREDVRIDIDTDAGSAIDVAHKLAIIPPGRSAVRVKAGGVIIRLFSTQSPELVALCHNRESYAAPHPNIPPFRAWPDPVGGFKLRVYPMDPPDVPGRFGRIYRSTNMMVNVMPPALEPRDPNKMSPHHHDDFEQCSLSLLGDYIHYIRWPWTANKAIWRKDAELFCRAPSMTVIPPPAIHTSQSLPPAPCQLIDIFSPPRVDFSEKGWVLNADDYPMPVA